MTSEAPRPSRAPGTPEGSGEQLALIRERVRRAPRPRPADPVTVELPVARVAVDVGLAHLDHPFDFLVPESLAASAVPGARVRVRFAGVDTSGFVLDRLANSDHDGRLARLSRVVSAEPALSPEIARLARTVADRYAGTLADVLRLAVPPRHARVEADPPTDAAPTPAVPDPGPWTAYPTGAAFLGALAAGRSPRAAWTPLPVTSADVFDGIARAMTATLASGRGALAVLPEARDVDRLDVALRRHLGADQHVVLSADLGPAVRYRRWLAVRRGARRAVIGTRAAMWAPVRSLGLVVCWDDGDDLHAEPRAPYPHVREVLVLRAHQARAAALVAGFHRTAEVAALVERRWLRSIQAPRGEARASAPLVRVAGDDTERARDPAARAARLPSLAWRAAREGLLTGPVLVQVARAGYLPALACASCRSPARCARCHGPLGTSGAGGPLRCGWCGTVELAFRCPVCSGTRLRARSVGARRTAEELGRAFPGVPVVTSGRDGVRATTGAEPSLVVSTPGAEPLASGGYAAALLLDGDLHLSRPSMRAGEEALRRWLGAAALVRPKHPVVLVADGLAAPVQALVRWDPVGFAARELADRRAAKLPPAVPVAELDGAASDLDDLLSLLSLPRGAEVLGPMPASGDASRARALVRTTAGAGRDLSRALQEASGVRSAAKRGGHVRVRVDPVDLG